MKYLLETKWHVIDMIAECLRVKRRIVKYKTEKEDTQVLKDRRYAQQRRRMKRR